VSSTKCGYWCLFCEKRRRRAPTRFIHKVGTIAFHRAAQNVGINASIVSSTKSGYCCLFL